MARLEVRVNDALGHLFPVGIVESWSLCPEDEGWTQRQPSGIPYYDYVQKYEALPNTFNPVQFDPAKWAAAAKRAGMKYMVFTTKHHDGFNMYDTKQSDYKITAPNVPFSKDPRADVTKEVFNAFRKEGIHIGAYYSKPDWHVDSYWWDYFPRKTVTPATTWLNTPSAGIPSRSSPSTRSRNS